LEEDSAPVQPATLQLRDMAGDGDAGDFSFSVPLTFISFSWAMLALAFLSAW
jgi:hypothetical protein